MINYIGVLASLSWLLSFYVLDRMFLWSSVPFFLVISVFVWFLVYLESDVYDLEVSCHI